MQRALPTATASARLPGGNIPGPFEEQGTLGEQRRYGGLEGDEA